MFVCLAKTKQQLVLIQILDNLKNKKMKKIIISLIFILSFLAMSAQSIPYQNSTGVISTTGVAKDSVVTGTALNSIGAYPVMVNMTMEYTTTLGNPVVTYSIQGSIDGTEYAPIVTATVTVDSSTTVTDVLYLSTGGTYPNGLYLPYWRAEIATSDSTATGSYEVDMNQIRMGTSIK